MGERARSGLAASARRWEGLLFGLLLLVVLVNAAAVPGYLGLQNQANLLLLGLEKAIVALVMAFVIISGEIDLSVASIMGLTGVAMAALADQGVPIEIAVLAAIGLGALLGLFNGFWVAVVGLPSLAVTLATLIGYRGLTYTIVEDRAFTDLPQSFKAFAQTPVLGPVPLSILLYLVLAAVAIVLLHRSGFGRYTYVLGNSRDVARFSGVRVRRVQLWIFTMSGLVAAIAGVIFAARLGAVRGSTAEGFELEIITMVLLGGVSIFGGSGTMVGVILSTFLVLNLRNGLNLASVSANVQAGIIGALLILSVLVPNLVRTWSERRRHGPGSGSSAAGPSPEPTAIAKTA
jgi:rhamnose transport system permease protein